MKMLEQNILEAYSSCTNMVEYHINSLITGTVPSLYLTLVKQDRMKTDHYLFLFVLLSHCIQLR